MELSNNLLKEFAAITNDKEKPNESTTYGIVSIQDDQVYVTFDGATTPTPVDTLVDVQNGDRVMVRIKNHVATITGISTPAAKRISSLGSYGEEMIYSDDGQISWLQKSNVLVENGRQVIEGEHENIWPSYSSRVPVKKTEYFRAGLHNSAIYNTNQHSYVDDMEPYGYAGIRLQGDTYQSFGQYVTTKESSLEDGTATVEGVCFIQPAATIEPNGIHWGCDYGDTYADASKQYKFAISDTACADTEGEGHPNTWMERKEFTEWLIEHAEEANRKYVWMMDNTAPIKPVYGSDLFALGRNESPLAFMDRIWLDYTLAPRVYGISSTTTDHPTEWISESEMREYLANHTSEANNKYIWTRVDYWWREWRTDRYSYTYNKFTTASYQAEEYELPYVQEELVTPAYNGMYINAGGISIDKSLNFFNRFKNVVDGDHDVDDDVTSHREYIVANTEDGSGGLDEYAIFPYQVGDDITISGGLFMVYYQGKYNVSSSVQRQNCIIAIDLGKPISEHVTSITATADVTVMIHSNQHVIYSASDDAHFPSSGNNGIYVAGVSFTPETGQVRISLRLSAAKTSSLSITNWAPGTVGLNNLNLKFT